MDAVFILSVLIVVVVLWMAGMFVQPFTYCVHRHPRFHRPVWTEEMETSGLGSRNWGITLGTVTAMERYCTVPGCQRISRRWPSRDEQMRRKEVEMPVTFTHRTPHTHAYCGACGATNYPCNLEVCFEIGMIGKERDCPECEERYRRSDAL